MAEISVTEIVFLDTVVHKGTKFQGSINSRCKNTFWTCGDLSIYALHLLSPAKREKRIRKRWSPANPSKRTRQRTLPWKTFQNLKDVCRTEVTLLNNTQYLYLSRPMFHHWNFFVKITANLMYHLRHKIAPSRIQKQFQDISNIHPHYTRSSASTEQFLYAKL